MTGESGDPNAKSQAAKERNGRYARRALGGLTWPVNEIDEQDASPFISKLPQEVRNSIYQFIATNDGGEQKVAYEQAWAPNMGPPVGFQKLQLYSLAMIAPKYPSGKARTNRTSILKTCRLIYKQATHVILPKIEVSIACEWDLFYCPAIPTLASPKVHFYWGGLTLEQLRKVRVLRLNACMILPPAPIRNENKKLNVTLARIVASGALSSVQELILDATFPIFQISRSTKESADDKRAMRFVSAHVNNTRMPTSIRRIAVEVRTTCKPGTRTSCPALEALEDMRRDWKWKRDEGALLVAQDSITIKHDDNPIWEGVSTGVLARNVYSDSTTGYYAQSGVTLTPLEKTYIARATWRPAPTTYFKHLS